MSLFWLILAVLICYGSYHMDIGTPGSPGPGFIPFLSGIVMAGSSLSILLISTIGKKKRPRAEKSVLTPRNRRDTILVILSLIGFMFSLNLLGFALCTLLFMGFLLRILGSQRWKTVILGSLFTSLGAFLLFQWVLKCQMPTGILGF
jgi:hypothetical protein